MAFRVAGSERDAAESSRMLGEDGDVGTPSVGRNHIVFSLPAYRKSKLPRHQMRGSKLGPSFGGQLAGQSRYPPPALREASLRIPVMTADASLGIPAAIAFARCEAANEISFRLRGAP